MKKVLLYGIVALAALSFSSCQKEVAVEENNNLVTVTLRAEKAGIDTRTEAVEEGSQVSFKWTAEDKENLKLFVVGKDDKGNDTFTPVDRVVNISSDYKTLTVTATVEENSTLRAVVAGLLTDKNKPKLNPNQSPEIDNFDPNADILVADDVTVDGLEEELLTFRRPVTINKMTLKNMIEGEKVHEITVSSDKNLVGYYNGEAMEGQAPNTITLAYNNVIIGDDGQLPVYFVAIPQEGHTLTVVVKTDQYTYTKTFGPVNFTVGMFSRFSVKLPAGDQVVSTDYSGDWVITGVNGDNAFAAQAYASGNNLVALGVSLDAGNEKITSSNVDGIKMHLEKVTEGDYADLYTIKDASGNYLYAASASSNQLKGATTLGENDYYWAVEKEADGSFSIKASKSSNRNVMQFNSGSSLFSCYGSATQKPVTLYPYSWVEEDTSASGAGTLDDPYNALGAIDAVKNLTWTSNTDYESTDSVYVQGKISRIANNGTYTEGGTYGNASFYISEDGNTVNEFYCFRVLYLGNKKFETGQTDIKVGDEVVIYGKLMNYQNNTPETVGNGAYLYSLNGVTEEEPAEKYTITVNPSENGTVVASASEAVAGAEITLTVTPQRGMNWMP